MFHRSYMQKYIAESKLHDSVDSGECRKSDDIAFCAFISASTGRGPLAVVGTGRRPGLIREELPTPDGVSERPNWRQQRTACVRWLAQYV